MKQQLRYGMVGGGPGAFIGDVHRKAIRMDNLAVLVAGTFFLRDTEKSKLFGTELGLSEDRLYTDFATMAREEAKREDGIQFVVCVTPNVSHFAICKAFLSEGISVVCDKPLTWTIEESEELVSLTKKKDLLFGGHLFLHWISRSQANASDGQRWLIGEDYVRQCRIPPRIGLPCQSMRTTNLPLGESIPRLRGISNCLGDIGSHIENMVANSHFSGN